MPRRFENHCRCCDRISKKPARCDYPNDVFAVCVRANGPPNLHGGPNPEMCKGLPRRRLMG